MTPPKKWPQVLLLILLIGILLPAVFALTTLRAKETELVRLQPKATDPDQDAITYTYASPFDEQGEWQTDYDDAGEYEVIIAASDGVQESKEKIKVIIENKNQPPRLSEKKISIKETQIADLKKIVDDPDDDALIFQFSGKFNQQGIWKTDYDAEGEYHITFNASDQEFTEKFTVDVEVLHTNQPPTIKNTFSQEKNIILKEDDTLEYAVEAEDHDDDKVLYRWTMDEQLLSEESSGERHFSFDEAGRHLLKVVLSDEKKETEKQWVLEVKNVNRKPELELLPMTVYEGETVVLELPETDVDGDKLQYEFPEHFTSEGIWKTGNDDAGEYNVTIMASDGEVQNEEILLITVLDVDRAPQLNLPTQVWAKEGEMFFWNLKVFDPDGDALKFRFEGLPEGAVFYPDNQTIYWAPSYEFIHRSGGWMSKLLNNLRLEHRFLRQRKMPITVIACGKELCSTSEITLIVQNNNRAPIFDGIPPLHVTATEVVHLQVSATDPDDDEVHYYFTDPLDVRKGTWKTFYEDVGTKTVYVTATDGTQGTTLPVNISVLKKNRLPKIKLSEDEVTVDEMQEFTLHVDATDKDNDPLTLALENLPKGASFKEGIFVWTPDTATVKESKEETEIIWLRFTVSDGEANVTAPVKVSVRNVNQRPEILDYLPVQEKEVAVGEPVLFNVAAKDADGNADALQYRWDFGFMEKGISGTDTIERTFTSPGKKKVRVTISDGQEKVMKEFSIVVKRQEMETVALAEPVRRQSQKVQPQPFTIGVYVVY